MLFPQSRSIFPMSTIFKVGQDELTCFLKEVLACDSPYGEGISLLYLQNEGQLRGAFGNVNITKSPSDAG